MYFRQVSTASWTWTDVKTTRALRAQTAQTLVRKTKVSPASRTRAASVPQELKKMEEYVYVSSLHFAVETGDTTCKGTALPTARKASVVHYVAPPMSMLCVLSTVAKVAAGYFKIRSHHMNPRK